MRSGPEGIRKRLEQARVTGFRAGLQAGEKRAVFAFEQAAKIRAFDIGER